MAFTKTDSIWMNGRQVPWDQATVHVLSHVVHYGSCILEGIRWAREGHVPFLGTCAGFQHAVIEIARNVPLLVHLYFWYLGLTALRLPAFWCGVLGLSLYSGAYVAEIVRSGVQAVSAGQRSAGLASGLSPRLVLRHIVYPQALRIVAPSLAGLFSQLIKDSSLASVISVAELTFVAGAIEGDTFRTFEAYIGITVLYLIAVTAISQITLVTLRSRVVEPAMRY